MVDLSVYKKGQMRTYLDELYDREQEAFNRRMMERQVTAREQSALGGGDDPAVLKINNAIAQALSNGDYETANRLERLAKTHDRGIDFYGAPPTFSEIMEMPPQEAMQVLSGQPSNATQLGQFGNLDAALEEMGTPQQYQSAPPDLNQFQTRRPQARDGYAEAIGKISSTQKGMEERARLKQQLEFEPQIAREKARQTELGKTYGETEASFGEGMARIPQLQNMVGRLSNLGNAATYTMAGRARDTFMREMGMDVPDSAVARADYITMVDNEILPLLRQTFGAQFTENEGKTLRATLGDANASPREKDARLRSFIRTKMEEVNTKARQIGQPEPFEQEAIDAFVSGIGAASGGGQQAPQQSGGGWRYLGAE